ncbi:AAA family ATPase [Kitasatospora purpeofusca]|uniref:AAA family ATPase n=1 Tax=Kitasatospora purpeofusca TaxID=67352 RepID=UPI0035E0A74B
MTVIWINGPFGGGKTTLATALLRALPGAVLLDPEKVGHILRETFPGKRKDFQDHGPWRPLVAAFAVQCHRYNDGRAVVVPMTLLREDYAREIHDAIGAAGVPLRHLLLHADSHTIGDRIESSTEYPGDEQRSEQVRVFRRRKLPAYFEAYEGWAGQSAEVIDTTRLTPGQVAERALAIVGAR